jgi:hypothetical protein
MGQAIPTQHPAVVLRSHFNQLRVLLALALVALCGLAAALVVLATNDRDAGARSATHATATLTQRAAPATFDPNSIKQAPGVRYDGGPEEGTRGAGR